MSALCVVGVCYTYLKQYKEALEALDHANSLHRHDATTMQARGHIHISIERKDTARLSSNEQQKKALSLFPHARGVALVEEGKNKMDGSSDMWC
jgi:Flp pilus assembly protein TadD